MARKEAKTGSPSLGVFAAGVVIGGIGGGLAGWLLGGHLAPLLTGVLNLISRNSKHGPMNFEAMQQ